MANRVKGHCMLKKSILNNCMLKLSLLKPAQRVCDQICLGCMRPSPSRDTPYPEWCMLNGLDSRHRAYTSMVYLEWCSRHTMPNAEWCMLKFAYTTHTLWQQMSSCKCPAHINSEIDRDINSDTSTPHMKSDMNSDSMNSDST